MRGARVPGGYSRAAQEPAERTTRARAHATASARRARSRGESFERPPNERSRRRRRGGGAPGAFTLAIDDNARYASSVETRDAGTIRLSGGAYRMVSENGPVAQGNIAVQSPTTAQISGPLGTATWQRELISATSGPAPLWVCG